MGKQIKNFNELVGERGKQQRSSWRKRKTKITGKKEK
jgi:hypothetical protein